MTGNCSPSQVIFKPRNRQANLNERRRLKMARSAHAYVRGSTLRANISETGMVKNLKRIEKAWFPVS